MICKMICKWCGEEFTPSIWPDFCSEGCMENDMESTYDPEERGELQRKFDAWPQRQEEEMERNQPA